MAKVFRLGWILMFLAVVYTVATGDTGPILWLFILTALYYFISITNMRIAGIKQKK